MIVNSYAVHSIGLEITYFPDKSPNNNNKGTQTAHTNNAKASVTLRNVT